MNTDFTKKVILGRTGLTVSRLGIASGFGVEAPGVEKAFHEAGINYFFLSAPRIKGLQTACANLAGNHREKMVIALQTYDHLGFLIKRRTEKTLKKLRIDYADILILSWFNKKPSRRILDKAYQLKKEGKIRFIGMSGHNRKTFGSLAQDPINPIDVFMVRYNAVNSGAEQDIFPYIKGENRPGITTYTATCWRKLLKAEKMPPDEKPLSGADCYRFVLSHPKVDVCLTAPANGAQLAENLKAIESGPLSEVEMKRIRKIGAFIHRK